MDPKYNFQTGLLSVLVIVFFGLLIAEGVLAFNRQRLENEFHRSAANALSEEHLKMVFEKYAVLQAKNQSLFNLGSPQVSLNTSSACDKANSDCADVYQTEADCAKLTETTNSWIILLDDLEANGDLDSFQKAETVVNQNINAWYRECRIFYF